MTNGSQMTSSAAGQVLAAAGELSRSGERLRAVLNIVLSLSLCLAGALFGVVIGTHFIGR